MSESETERGGIGDEDLPEDLQPGEENPLAEPPDADEVDRDDLDLLGSGKPAAESTGEADQQDGSDGEDDPA